MNLKKRALEILGSDTSTYEQVKLSEDRARAWSCWSRAMKQGDLAKVDPSGQIVEIVHIDPTINLSVRVRPITGGEVVSIAIVNLHPVSGLEALGGTAE